MRRHLELSIYGYKKDLLEPVHAVLLYSHFEVLASDLPVCWSTYAMKSLMPSYTFKFHALMLLFKFYYQATETCCCPELHLYMCRYSLFGGWPPTRPKSSLRC